MTAPADSRGFTTLGIVGAGLMGAGLAHVAAKAGLQVLLYDADPEALARGQESVATGLRRDVDRGRLTEEERARSLERVAPASGLAQVAGADAVIEAVVEQLPVKQEVFRELALSAAADTLLATNTSAISISDIAATADGPERIVGMHFFSPVPAMRLCEVVRGFRTSDATLRRALELASVLGKESIVVNRDDAGFVTSRLMTVLVQEAARLVEQGLATAEDVDAACVLGFGHRMGPLATADLTGVDVAYRAGRSIYDATGDPAFKPPQLLRRMVSAGYLGRKSGRGFYDYGEDRT